MNIQMVVVKLQSDVPEHCGLPVFARDDPEKTVKHNFNA